MPYLPWLVQVRVTPHQVYCALDVSKHLNLLYLVWKKRHAIIFYFLSLHNPQTHIPSKNMLPLQVKSSCSYSEALTWSLHMELTLLRLLLPMPTGGPIGGSEPGAPEPPAMDTVILMLLYTPCWPKLCELAWPVWLYRLTKQKQRTLHNIARKHGNLLFIMLFTAIITSLEV